jgi:cytoskeletal protein CcmA (bactofilin family)
MWRKPEEGKPQSGAEAPGAAAPSATRPAASSSSSTLPVSPNAPACVSQGIKIKGEIFGKEDLFIDGTIEGKIHFTDGCVTIGPNGRVNADIEAREIVIRGDVSGTLKARERVQIWGTGKLSGDMHTRGIVIEDGATLRGKVEVTQKEEARSARPGGSGGSGDAFARAALQAKSSES